MGGGAVLTCLPPRGSHVGESYGWCPDVVREWDGCKPRVRSLANPSQSSRERS
jgi:hypothetical protein